MPRLLILGSGTPEPVDERWGTSFVLEIAAQRLMVDCGPATTYKMHRMGVSPTQIDHLLFTHLHSDHIADYPCFLMTRFDMSTGKEPDLQVYGPPPIRDITEGLWSPERGVFWYDVVARTKHPMSVGAYHLRGGSGPRPEPVVRVHEFGEGEVVQEPSWRCYARQVRHAQPYIDCFGFRLETDEGVVAFSGDTAPVDAVVDLGWEADLLVMSVLQRESVMQTSSARGAMCGTIGAAELAQRAGAKRLVVNHQAKEMAPPAEMSAAIHEVKSVYEGLLFWGKDMMEVSW